MRDLRSSHNHYYTLNNYKAEKFLQIHFDDEENKITILWSFFENWLRKLEGGEFCGRDIFMILRYCPFLLNGEIFIFSWVQFTEMGSRIFSRAPILTSSIIINGDGPVWNIVLSQTCSVFLNKLSFWVKFFFFIKHWYFLSSGGSKPNKPAVLRMQPLNNECWIFQTPWNTQTETCLVWTPHIRVWFFQCIQHIRQYIYLVLHPLNIPGLLVFESPEDRKEPSIVCTDWCPTTQVKVKVIDYKNSHSHT